MLFHWFIISLPLRLLLFIAVVTKNISLLSSSSSDPNYCFLNVRRLDESKRSSPTTTIKLQKYNHNYDHDHNNNHRNQLSKSVLSQRRRTLRRTVNISPSALFLLIGSSRVRVSSIFGSKNKLQDAEDVVYGSIDKDHCNNTSGDDCTDKHAEEISSTNSNSKLCNDDNNNDVVVSTSIYTVNRRHRAINTNVRSIMNYILDRYKEEEEEDDDDEETCHNNDGNNHSFIAGPMETMTKRNTTTKQQEEQRTNRYSKSNNSNNKTDWDKIRRYLYRVSEDKINLRKVKSIIEFLEEVFPTTTTKAATTITSNSRSCATNKRIQRWIVQSVPRIFSKSIVTNLQPTVSFLKQLYGTELFVHAIERNPKLLLSTGVGYNDKQYNGQLQVLQLFLHTQLHVSYKEIDVLQTSAPYLFQLSMVHILQFVNYFKNLLSVEQSLLSATTRTPSDTDNHNEPITNKIFHNSTEQQEYYVYKSIGQLIVLYPQIVPLSIEQNIHPRIEFLKRYCGLYEPNDIPRVIQHNRFGCIPSLFGLSIEETLVPKIQLLLSILSTKQLINYDETINNNDQKKKKKRKMLNPNSNNNTIEKSVSLLRNVVLSHPQILGLSIHNIQTKIQYFDSIDRISSTNTMSSSSTSSSPSASLACKILCRSPSVFSLSLYDNIIPTIQYLAQNVWNVPIPSTVMNMEDDDIVDKRSHQTLAEYDLVINQELMRRNKNDTKPNRKNTSPRRTKSNNKNKSLSSLLGEYPSILTLSLEGNIQPTIQFYNRTGYLKIRQYQSYDSSRIKDTSDSIINHHVTDNLDVQQQQQRQQQHENESTGKVQAAEASIQGVLPGRYIAASLFHRLLPRWHYYVFVHNNTNNNGNSNNDNKQQQHNMTMLIPLHILAGATDTSFCKYYGIDINKYNQYKKESVPTLKFNSQFDIWLTTGRPIDV